MSPVVDPTLEFERELHAAGATWVIGCDEVGRGAIAGPVAVGLGAVHIDCLDVPAGLRDSKLLSEKRREALYPLATSWVSHHAVGFAEAHEVDRLGRYIVRLIAISLGLPATSLDHHFDHPTTFLRALHYPPQPPADDDQMGSAPHTDYGIITLLAQDDSGGLQVRPRGGDWIEAPPIENTYVLNVGDMLARWTNGRFVSTPHRVINRSGGDRYSLPYFLDPSMDAVIECLPTCTDAEHPPLHPPVPYGEYLMERLNKNYDYRRDTSKASA